MVGSFDFQLAQEIRVNFVPRRGLAGVRAAIDRFDAHVLHQRRHMAAPNLHPLAPQQIAQHPRARKGEIEMQLVKAAHQLQVLVRDRLRLVIDRAPRKAERLRLPDNREVVAAVDHRFALSNPAFVSAPSKKSFSSVSSPILA